jgi:hypothetical protein
MPLWSLECCSQRPQSTPDLIAGNSNVLTIDANGHCIPRME